MTMEIDYFMRDRVTGRLLPGSKLGGGNPYAKRQQELRKALMNCATDDDVKAIYESMLSAAKKGEVAAAKVLLDHLLGRPMQAVQVTGESGEPLKIDISKLTAVVLTALGTDSDARWRVAEALSRFGASQLEAERGPVDGAEPPA
jgi:hypothetical protein